MKNKGLAFKLSLYILSSVVVIFVIILFYNYKISKELILKNVEESTKNLTFSTVNKIESILNASEKIPDNVSYVLDLTSNNHLKIIGLLKSVIKENNEIFGTCIAFEPYSLFEDSLYYAPYCWRKNDSIKYKNIGSNDYQYFNMDWYQIPKELNHPVWTEPYYDEFGGEIIMSTYSVPFYDIVNGEKKFKGIATIDISLSWLEKIVSSIKIFKSGFAFLISKNGTFITHPVPEFIMNESIFSIADKYDHPNLHKIGQDMISGKTGFVQINPVSTKRKSWVFYAPLPSNNWSLAIVIPENELFADLHLLHNRLILIGVFGFIVLFILIFFISRKITNPLRELVSVTKQIGSGNFNVILPVFKAKDEISELSNSFVFMQNELKNYIKDLKDTTAAKEKIESELKIAHDIQQGIIPKIFPPFPERIDIDIFAILDPAKEVGGDLYDFFFINDHKIAFAIGDVSGKGVPASLFMAITTTLLRAKTFKDQKVNDIVKSINIKLCKDNENAMFVTFFLGIIDLRTGEINYCNAGHNYPYILRANKKLEILNKTHGTPLGLFEQIDYKSDKIVLDKQDTLILYTDGIPEAMDNKGNLYEDHRLQDTLLKLCCNKSAKEITTELVKSTKKFASGTEQSDDITILVLSYF
ncbi:MAG: SpoIIE family protein phosphatase [Bacteroidales bacterium]|nr:SpoIIE family protein phosphatase [Bacteroidales bacterium]